MTIWQWSTFRWPESKRANTCPATQERVLVCVVLASALPRAYVGAMG